MAKVKLVLAQGCAGGRMRGWPHGSRRVLLKLGTTRISRGVNCDAHLVDLTPIRLVPGMEGCNVDDCVGSGRRDGVRGSLVASVEADLQTHRPQLTLQTKPTIASVLIPSGRSTQAATSHQTVWQGEGRRLQPFVALTAPCLTPKNVV